MSEQELHDWADGDRSGLGYWQEKDGLERSAGKNISDLDYMLYLALYVWLDSGIDDGCDGDPMGATKELIKVARKHLKNKEG